jgi:hypothetical protein
VIESRRFALSARERSIFLALAALGAAVAAAGAAQQPDRVLGGVLLVSQYAMGLGLAGLCFVAIHYTTGASWSVAIRRVPEGLAATLPLSTLLLLVVFATRPQLYAWTGADFTAEGGPGSAFKHWWLRWPFFLVRSGAYCAAWMLFAAAIRRASKRQDADGDPRWTRGNTRLSAAFLIVFSVTFAMASVDWIMSLEAGWYSTIFGVYAFAGLFSSGLAAIIAGVLWVERRGALQNVLTENHLHDLGKLLFAFSIFWMYIWLSQYLLIWYTNIPEEAAYFGRRTQGWWLALTAANVLLNWVVPFLVLLRRDAKRDRRTLAWVAALVLIGRWIDLYVMIFPPIVGDAGAPHVWELGATFFGIGAFCLFLARTLGGAPLVPVADPQLQESLSYEQ